MAKIFQFPYHILLGVDTPCGCTDHGGEACVVCHGGLALCVVCGGAEASLPTHCPGEPMHEIIGDEVQAGVIDYDCREGWIQGTNAGIKQLVRGNHERS